ncbi:unnamed protein product [Meloidogyne enterolobii]|uniref:Uncharacterized protein n=1 Tax=Meloidogyne enterolobii TaxID=390850 RepID=A0ACB0ZZI7_MELEN
MDPEKTIFVNWDESAINEKPLGCVGENRPFLFSRDLALIYTALNIPASELDIQKFARLPSSSLISSSTTPSLTICVPIKANSKLKENKKIEKDKGNNLNNEEKEEENIFLLPNNEECENEGNKELLLNINSANQDKLREEKERQLSVFDSGIDSSCVIAL